MTRRQHRPISSRVAPLTIACVLLSLGPLLLSTTGCMGVQEADASIAPDAVPEDFEAPEADAESIECFHRALADGGEWEQRAPFGEVWAPRVPEGWRPYTQGNWVETDQGWGWEAEEPWGWAVFHYGRWFYGPERKWLWIPGTRWAPAWVAWRWGGSYVGWAPLPPTIGFVASRGLDPGSASIHATHFSFVPESALLTHNLRSVMLPVNQNATILGRTRDITRYTMVRHRVFDLGVSPRRITEIVGHPLEPLKVARLATSAGSSRGLFYQPPALAKLSGRSWSEFGSTASHRGMGSIRGSTRSEEIGGHGIAAARTRRSRGDQEAVRFAHGASTLRNRWDSRNSNPSGNTRRQMVRAQGNGRIEASGRFSEKNQMGERERVAAIGPRTSQTVQPRPLQTMRGQRAISSSAEALRSQAPRPERAQGYATQAEAQRSYTSAPRYQPRQVRDFAPPPQPQRSFMPAPPHQAHGAPTQTPSGGRHRPP